MATQLLELLPQREHEMKYSKAADGYVMSIALSKKLIGQVERRGKSTSEPSNLRSDGESQLVAPLMRAICRFDQFLGSQLNTRLLSPCPIAFWCFLLSLVPRKFLCVRRTGIYALTSLTPKFSEELLAATEE